LTKVIIYAKQNVQYNIKKEGLIMTSQKTKRFNVISFFKQVKSEALKITWPTKKETVTTSIMVFIMIAFFAMFFFIVDQVLGLIIKLVLGMGA
jgi:preprotein translocase subunit SecE